MDDADHAQRLVAMLEAWRAVPDPLPPAELLRRRRAQRATGLRRQSSRVAAA